MHPLPPPPDRGPRARNQGSESTTQTQLAVPPPGADYVGNNSQTQDQGPNSGPKKRKHRGGKKKRNRRQSFAAPSEDGTVDSLGGGLQNEEVLASRSSLAPKPFYRLGQTGGNLSSNSLDSEALLDHRDQPSIRMRRESRVPQNTYNPYRSSPPKTYSRRQENSGPSSQRQRTWTSRGGSREASEEEHDEGDDKTPLLAAGSRSKSMPEPQGQYGSGGRNQPKIRRESQSTASSTRGRRGPSREASYPGVSSQGDYDVNNPPSVPSSPKLGAEMGYDDVMMGGFATPKPPDMRRDASYNNDTVIDMNGRSAKAESSPPTPRLDPHDSSRRRTVALPAEEDVCFPVGGMSEIAEEDYIRPDQNDHGRNRRRRRRMWPDLSILEDWSREEKEDRSEGIRAMRVSEPVLVGGRLRPTKSGWHRTEEDAPYRFTYFNEEFQSTIHAQTISELQDGGSFQELFIPDPPELDESSDDDDEDEPSQVPSDQTPLSPGSQAPNTRQSSVLGDVRVGSHSREHSGQATPQRSAQDVPKSKRYGPRPTFWMDILSPTDAEMRVISKAFGIHALTAEDIMMQEAREKVELFRNYYFINYRSFEQDMNNEDFLEPLNMYVIVFREGVLSFHFSQTPHPANVRRRIRQLKDYLILTSDWISYAIIDDITDVFQPLIQSIEDEVDEIDDNILEMHAGSDEMAAPRSSKGSINEKEKKSEAGEKDPRSGIDMLRRVGEGRKKVMGLYRLLGNKADVIKGFAKRCNEQWEVAPKSEIGLYLGDIQDHILTMTSNLGHYETLLSRAHSNYLAQINIRMNERQEQTADVLGKLTVLGTIVLPMNIICGMWGMNVKVPGQEIDNLYWFWSITAGLVCFAVCCFYVAKRVYNIV